MADDTVHVSLTAKEKRRIRAAAGREDMSMSEFGRQAILEWLERHGDEDDHYESGEARAD